MEWIARFYRLRQYENSEIGKRAGEIFYRVEAGETDVIDVGTLEYCFEEPVELDARTFTEVRNETEVTVTTGDVVELYGDYYVKSYPEFVEL